MNLVRVGVELGSAGPIGQHVESCVKIEPVPHHHTPFLFRLRHQPLGDPFVKLRGRNAHIVRRNRTAQPPRREAVITKAARFMIGLESRAPAALDFTLTDLPDSAFYILLAKRICRPLVLIVELQRERVGHPACRTLLDLSLA